MRSLSSWICIAAFLGFAVIVVVWAAKPRNSRFLKAYRELSGTTEMPMPLSTMRAGDHAEFSIKVHRTKPTEKRRLCFQFTDYRTFKRYIPTSDMRAWEKQHHGKVPCAYVNRPCGSYYMAVDGGKYKIYLDTGKISYSYSDRGVQRTYVMDAVGDSVPDEVVDMMPFVDSERMGIRSTPGNSAKAYYFPCAAPFKYIFSPIQSVAAKVGMSKETTKTLLDWMRRAEAFGMEPSWFQFLEEGEITLYARFQDDRFFHWGN